ncbi:MAG: hypothetical protein Ct9H300mP9_1700 [Candidatus Neomarinimicrobiota bacterium]|nr:MAG: hypothetical protein Ct9H300mP9_1700 [Candidatus Neomarinimicrobiota bacterium]
MTSIGPDEWSKEFSPNNFNSEEDLGYLNWSREYQPGYMFRNLGNDEVYFNDQIIRLLQNYRSAYMQLAVTYYLDHQKETRKKDPDKGVLNDLREKTLLVLDQMRINIPESTITITAEDLHYQVARLYGDLDRKETMKQIMDELTSTPIGRPGNRVEYANVYYRQLSDTSKALSILENLQGEFLQLESMIKVKGFGKKNFFPLTSGKDGSKLIQILFHLWFIYTGLQASILKQRVFFMIGSNAIPTIRTQRTFWMRSAITANKNQISVPAEYKWLVSLFPTGTGRCFI